MAGAGVACFFKCGAASVSQRLVRFANDVAIPFGGNEVLGVSVGDGVGAGFGFGFGFCFDFSCLPGCSWLRSSGFISPTVCVKSGSIKASRLTPWVSTFLSVFWPRFTAATTLVTMSLMRLPHSESFPCYMSRISSFSCNHVFIPRHCSSCSVVCFSILGGIFTMVWCGCAGSWAWCRANCFLSLLQCKGSGANVRAWLLLLCFPFSCSTVSTCVGLAIVPGYPAVVRVGNTTVGPGCLCNTQRTGTAQRRVVPDPTHNYNGGLLPGFCIL